MTRRMRMGVTVLAVFAAIASAVGLGQVAQAMDMSSPGDVVRVGVLKFGTVNWELNVIKENKLDEANGFNLEVVGLTGKNASAVALQGGKVDIIVTDYIWASRQRSEGDPYVFVPHSLAVGGLMVRPDSGIESLEDLKGKDIGIAGGPVDKSWLLLRAYAEQELGVDLADVANPKFAAPPLLNELMLKGDIPAVLNFWHYNARLKAEGMTQLIGVADILPALGVEHQGPLLGWVFSEKWADEHPELIDGFLKASLAAKKILATSDEEWERLRETTRAKNDETFIALRDAYREGIVTSYNEQDIRAAEQTYAILAELGGEELVGPTPNLAPGTFWSGFSF
jgi:NitT/TauT family transport system substrate-binding protein